MRDLGTLGGQFAKAFSINNSGVVTGTAQVGFGFHAFLWDAANGMRDIGTIGGNTSSGAFINANGHVAGTSTINGIDNREHAFLYDGTTMINLGAIGDNDFLSDRSTGYGINLQDEVVGTTYRPYEGGSLYQIAFVYRDGQMFDSKRWSTLPAPTTGSTLPRASMTRAKSPLMRSRFRRAKFGLFC